MSKSVPLVQRCQTSEFLRDTFRTSSFILKGVVNFSESLKIKVIVSDFHLRNLYAGICPSTFVKSDSNKLPRFKSSSDCLQIIRGSSEGFSLPLVLSVRVCGSSTTDKGPCQVSLRLLNKNVWLAVSPQQMEVCFLILVLLLNTDFFVICLQCLYII